VPDLAAAGAAAYEMYQGDGDRAMLDAAVAAFEQALALAVPGLPERVTVQSNLGLILLDRHDATGDEDDLRRSLRVLDDARRSAPDPERRRIATVNYVSAVTATRDPGALREAAELLAGDDDPAARACLGQCLVELFRLTGEPEALERAVAALDGTDGLANLGIALSERHLLTGHTEDLDRAVSTLRAAADAGPPGSPHRPARLAALGSVLAERFSAGGDPADLDEAVTTMEAALRGAPDVAEWQQNLAVVLRDRYLRDGDLADLERARALLSRAETADAAWADQMAVTARMRWQRRGEREDLDRAVALHRTAAAAADGPQAAIVRNNAGGTYRALWAATGDPAVLDEALGAYRAALEAMPTTSPERAAVLANLSMGLVNRHAATGDPANLDEAVTATRQAVELPAADRPGRLLTLANALATRGDSEAGAAYREAATGAEPVAAEVWLRSAQAYGDWSAGHGEWRQAATAYDAAVTAADRVLRRQLSPADVEAWLYAVRTLPAAAALAELRTGDAKAAAGRLEWGRARLLADALDRDRADLRALAAADPGAAARYRAAAARLRSLEVRP
jgi:Tfp pilus assembly protein PilF